MTLSGAVEKNHLPTNITLFFYGNKKYSNESGVGGDGSVSVVSYFTAWAV